MEQTSPAVLGPVEPTVMQRADDCPAFPVQDLSKWQFHGMSLRDYFAIHGTQPGMSEIVKAAGFVLDRTNRVYTTKDGPEGMHFNEWWQALTLETQCDLCARVRYAQADAMLRVRAA